MMRSIVATALGLAAACAQAAEYSQFVREKSTLAFGYKQMGVTADGRFRRFDAQLAFDPARPEAGRARFEVEMASIDTGSAEADEEVKGKNWFDVTRFPAARFVSSAIKPLGGNRYEVAGTLTIKGASREVRAPVSFTNQGSTGQFEGAFTIKRLDYKIGEGVWSDLETVADEVQVKFRIAVSAAK